MGNRASYVLIENGEHHLYFSRWGALSLPAVLLSGPDATLAYVKALTPVDYLLNDTWAEGGLLLDADARRVRCFGGNEVDGEPHLRRLLLGVLAGIWAGWEVRWAVFGIGELAVAIGWSPWRVADTDFDDHVLLEGTQALVPPSAIRSARTLRSTHLLLTVRWSDSVVADYALAANLAQALSQGPHLLDIVKQKRGTALPREDQASQCAYIDVNNRAIWLGTGRFGVSKAFDLRYFEALAKRWPGWQFEAHAGGVVQQVVLSGRDPASNKVPREQAVQDLVEDLVGDYTIDPDRLFAALTRDGGPITVGDAFFSKDDPPLSRDERRRLLMRLVEEAQDY